MAPKRRPKKGESRMDAALDAMKPYGFPNRLVRTTVNSLLKVYGGNGGWFFIEESAYSLLIETLLEKQANSSPQDGLIEANPDGPNEVTPAGCSNSALLACSNTQTSDDTLLTNQAADTVSSSSGTGIQLPINGVDTVSAKTEIGSELPIKSVDISSVPSEPANQPLIKAASETPIEAFKESGYQCRKRNEAASETPMEAEKESEFQPVKKLALAENHVSKSPQLGTGLSDKRYKPCYGWISNDDEEEEELIELPLAPWLSGVN
ncbi:hypothetical protein AAZX31_20G215500 [Glycine max]|uniref:WIYLD domain-containing protein n=1 Tax=Glycine max TaxID=3847 RepID=K7N558_SOYBN|nr:uncharacterized protein LOC100778316 isoform X1 [Glycine max]KAG4919790.1 hypothetical protein JHK85_058071 [Glycine max]KHN20180.1 hypothetical protein glysoja_023743 [Glycine soja]KRG92776.1 hypothetical protein GLYMA_20G229400v4 [Glycine max]|eukprot:XP_003555585.1 uncharacterized protein LOC100778316 isoform X1 [Glycine max]